MRLFKCSYNIKTVIFKRKRADVSLQDFASSAADGAVVCLPRFLNTYFGIIDAVCFFTSFKQAFHICAAAAAVKGSGGFFFFDESEAPIRKGGVACAVHTVDHHFTEKALRFFRLAENFFIIPISFTSFQESGLLFQYLFRDSHAKYRGGNGEHQRKNKNGNIVDYGLHFVRVACGHLFNRSCE